MHYEKESQYEMKKENYSTGIHAAMEYDLHDYYKILAELKMEKPTLTRLNAINCNRTDALCDIVALYEEVNLSLMGSEFDKLQQYTQKFRHFVHLFFADEKLELASKFKEDIKVQYKGHRSAPQKNKRGKYAPVFAVYEFKLSAQSTEDLVLYQMISINTIRGKITFINRNTNCIEVAFEDRKGTLEFDQNMTYYMDIEFNERQYEAFMFSIYFIERGKADFVVFPTSSGLISEDEFARQLVEFKHTCKTDPDLVGFDEQQQLAIFSIVNGIHGTTPFVLWGPPGTGKTVTLVECVRQLMQRDETNRILICTPSNTAADLIARRIYKTGILPSSQMRRYYSLGKSVDERDKELDQIIVMENCSIYGLIDERFKIEDYAILKKDNIRLIFSTLFCSSYLSQDIYKTGFFSHIFIDEAGQSIEPETLIPLTRFATQKTRIVLCGDHQQLGPVVKAHFLKPYKSCHLSLMERLMTTMRPAENCFANDKQQGVYLDGRTFCQLTDSYRCHPKIIHFSSVNFYSGTLRAVNEENRKAFCNWNYLPSKNFPVIFHALTKGVEVQQSEGRSFHNEAEVEIVLKYIELLRETGDIEDSDIGVISPYKQQTLKIRDCLMGREITVDSVECYQGSERRAIILTLSRSKQPGFLSEYKRLNTSLTRAKELVIVVASLDFVRNLFSKRNSNNWIGFIKYCIENNAVLVDGFAGDSDFNEETLARNANLLRRCLRETFHSDFMHIERKKRPEVLKFSPPIRKFSDSISSTSESDDEDEGTVSDLSPYSCSSDEEGKQFWARQIPWRKESAKQPFYNNTEVGIENAMSKLMSTNDADDIQYEDLTGGLSEKWPENGEQDNGYNLWLGSSSVFNAQNFNGMSDSNEVLRETEMKSSANGRFAVQNANRQRNATRISEARVFDQQRHARSHCQMRTKSNLTAEIATHIEDESFYRANGENSTQANDQNCAVS